MNREFKGIWIPAKLWMDSNLTPLEKCLYAEIDSLDCSKDHCYASNEYFAEFLQCSIPTISRSLFKLEDYFHIKIEYKSVPWGRQRVITALIKMMRSPNQNDETPSNQNDEHINIKNSINKDNTNKESQAIPDEALQCSELLFSLHQGKIDTGYSVTEAQKKSWALDIEKLHRIDGRSWENIAEAIRWIKTPGQFWAPNIMSGKKLRDKFPQVWAKMHDKPKVETTEEQLRRLGKIS